MSNFKNAFKSQKVHRERSQPAARAHLGILEKKKDYRQRADDYNKKQQTIKALKRKALDKNPDEFYFKMVKTQMKDGVHEVEEEAPQYTEEQLKMMQTQDLKYVNYKRSTELRKIEKMKSSLHMLDATTQPQNKHKIFVDSEKEAKDFDLAKHFGTHPALLGRTYNRLKVEQLKSGDLPQLDEETLQKLSVTRKQQYKELSKRIDREKELNVIAQKMEMKRHLADKKAQKKKIKDETPTSAAVYRWVPKRKK